MNKILAIMGKELYTVFSDRTVILIMFITPIILSTIMGLAFGGFGGSASAPFQDIPIAIVNLDEGFNLADQSDGGSGTSGEALSLNDLEFAIGGETVNIGEQLQRNPNLNISDTDLSAGNANFRFGDLLTDILTSGAVTETGSVTGTETTTATVGFNLENLTCPLIAEETTTDEDGGNAFGFEGTLDDLLEAVLLTDPAAARAGVDSGDFVAAIIIPANFSNQMMPTFDLLAGAAASTSTPENEGGGEVEIYANMGQSIAASIVRAVVEGIVNQLVRVSVALESVLNTGVNTLSANFNLNTLSSLDLSTLDPEILTGALGNIDASVLDSAACLVLPNTGNIQLQKQPLDATQTLGSFAFIMTILGSTQAIFFALFTGIFGMNSIYEEKNNWTLQRLIVSPTPRSFVLAGKLLGNIVVVVAQLIVLFTSFTVIASLVEGTPTFIWGTNIPLLLLAILGISIFVSGLGVFVVGIAKSSEQVQLFGPMVAVTLGALSGGFGFELPPQIAGFSPVWQGSQALRYIASGELTKVTLPLLILFGTGASLFAIGTYFFKRRLDL